MTLGRAADNDLVVPDSIPEADTVSQHHAQFRRDQDDYIVRDLNSQNGLTVNQRHTNHNVLQDGDQLGFGAAQATFRKSSGGAA
jgi:pSer/pThr/pTyr-binding forkhead associated (FHA) protein